MNSGGQRKRKRTTTVSHACAACRSKHLKCDGNHPTCGRCAQKGISCDWTRKRRKRGPVAGKAAKLETEVESLHNEIKRNANEAAHWKHLYEAIKRGTHSKSSNKPKKAKQLQSQELDISTLTTTVYAQFAQVYLNHVNPILGLDVSAYLEPANISKMLTDETKASSPAMLVLYGVLAVGAQRRAGNADLAFTLAGKCRLLLCDFFDLNHPEVATGLCLLSQYHQTAGEATKAVYYYSMAVNMCKNLLKNNVQNVPDSEALGDVYRVCTLSLGEHAETRKEALDTFSDLACWLQENFMVNGNFEETTITLQYLHAKFLYTWYSIGHCKLLSQRWNENEDPTLHLTLARLDKLLRTVNDALRMLSQLTTCPLWKESGTKLANILKAQILLLLGRNAECESLASIVNEEVHRAAEEHANAWSIQSLFILAIVHLRLGDSHRYARDCRILKSAASVYPETQILVKSLYEEPSSEMDPETMSITRGITSTQFPGKYLVPVHQGNKKTVYDADWSGHLMTNQPVLALQKGAYQKYGGVDYEQETVHTGQMHNTLTPMSSAQMMDDNVTPGNCHAVLDQRFAAMGNPMVQTAASTTPLYGCTYNTNPGALFPGIVQ
mmetsp:Transcript_4843/g.5246  ORF Transcript_4843/g.5246 Transcript_4843/m.5246 type:complete len:610 (+) Transcript_4843:34-1863(+)